MKEEFVDEVDGVDIETFRERREDVDIVWVAVVIMVEGRGGSEGWTEGRGVGGIKVSC